MVRFSLRPPPGRLFLHRADGRSVRRELPARALETFSRKLLDHGGAEALKSWERAGQLGSADVLRAWPAGLPRPERALLGGGGPHPTGLWLEAAFAPGAALQEIADDLTNALLDKQPVERVLAEAEPVARHEAPLRMPATPLPGVSAAAVSAALPAVVLRTELRPLDAEPEERLDFEDLGADLLDTSVNVRPADLPGLNPGDRLHSPRRGRCTVLRPYAGPALSLLRDARGQELPVAHAELTAEFSFDDAAESDP